MTQWSRGEFTLDTDLERLDLDLIARTLQAQYWAATRSTEDVYRSWRAAGVVFGLYRGDELIGWCRVVTDFVAIAYLADVFIFPQWRGQGLGLWMMVEMLRHPDLRTVEWFLHTRDAHGLYRKVGFVDVTERIMQRLRGTPPPDVPHP